MAVYSTCRGCAIAPETCARRAEIRAGLDGLAVTEVKFRCTDRKPVYQIGERVIWSTTISDEYEPFETEFNATVVDEVRRGRFLIKVDYGPDRFGEVDAPECFDQGRLYVTSPLLRLRKHPDDTLRRSVCPTCQASDDAEEACFRSGLSYPEGCLLTQTEEAA